MYKKMSYEDVYEWAKNKLISKHSNSNKIEEIVPFCSEEDAVKELVMETCDDVSKTPMCEMKDKQFYLDEINKLELRMASLEYEKNKAFEFLQKAYSDYIHWEHSLKYYLEEILDGRKSVRDLKESELWQYPPQTFEYEECAKHLGKELINEKFKTRTIR